MNHITAPNSFLLSRPPSSRSLTAYNNNINNNPRTTPKHNTLNSPLTPPASLPKQTPALIRSRRPSPTTTTTNQPQFDSPLSSPIPLTLQNNTSPSSSSSSSCHHHHPQHQQLRRLSQISSPPIPVKESSNGRLSEDGLSEGQRRLNQYLLIRSIGRGSYGSVELAKDTTNHRLYAVKEYSKKQMRKRAQKSALNRRFVPPSNHLPITSDGIHLVKAEVAIMKKLAHVNIVCLHEVIDTETDSLFFVLELCPYGPVMQIQKGAVVPPLTEKSARNIFRQLVLGIEYLHFHEIIHRDIKPDNILYFEDPRAVFDPLYYSRPGDNIDGVVLFLSDTMHKSAGSPAFIAPEMCKGSSEGVHGRMADIWAMGVTLFALVFGRLPFEDDNPIGLYEKIMNDPLEFPTQEISDSLVELLTCMLNKAAERRIEMEEIRVSRWVTEEGKDPLEQQSGYLEPMEPPTDLEIAEAFKSFKTVATIFRAISKFRTRKSTSSQSTSTSTSTSHAHEDASLGMVRTRSDTTTSNYTTKSVVESPKSSFIISRPSMSRASLGFPSSSSSSNSSPSSSFNTSSQSSHLVSSTTLSPSSSSFDTTTSSAPASNTPGFSHPLDIDPFHNHPLVVQDFLHPHPPPLDDQLDFDNAINSLAVLDL